ncbi:hypothetical protein PaeCFBP13512_12835 [Paenibacillus sp. CFBP13512]|uniref:hypothetical protein n=1 Tax=Paenibacillus sp. CFBP13512 TaxID=2184007 RepID=UPI0010C0EA84|nr:hypothetical protein [Paenibacillus sp. CFBP13512]TKJ90710.1 hypothetical protein PaeCFBP13512_12835 [Paenibacillus sp. CFBP13512]
MNNTYEQPCYDYAYDLLEIDKKAVDLRRAIELTINNNDELNTLLLKCMSSMYTNSMFILNYLTELRSQKLYGSKLSLDEFLSLYEEDKNNALTRLFRCIVFNKDISLLEIDNPFLIYELYCNEKPDIYFYDFVRLYRK